MTECVLEYRDKPEKTGMHGHPDFVWVARSAFKRQLTLAGWKTVVREFKLGELLWTEAHSHVGKNIGDTETAFSSLSSRSHVNRTGATKPQ